ncbi:hypothetical protein K701_26185 [Streptomyces fradiae ATCC 10745 = DSM 40063]|uniref:Uncharacterized protein n=2 Tax=Streptomyces TaxID=1883 RepID=A0A1D8FW54_9ACTN|nr:hypothetical protein A4G23_00226 [Streptomyces rubrolavendulae]KAF0646898.1 hypothetical protein K701_26185 [Streptomyces fradiae ATCC 10745 = DSM 40063]OSY51576.1 hypothetical protein BG846_02787 [Streptomyces fradiae ATCC 10745 = DSM 40063]
MSRLVTWPVGPTSWASRAPEYPEPVPDSATFMPAWTSRVVSSRWMTAGLERCGVAPRPSWWV